jgi:hypothetical protein
LNVGTANAVTMRTEQTLDTHGNVTQTKVYDYAAGSNPGPLLRTYTNTYLTDPNYTSRNIYNRLGSSTVSNGGSAVTLVNNSFDESAITDASGMREHDANYTTGFRYRGNVTTQWSVSSSRAVTRTYDIGGNVLTASDGNLQVSASTGSATNYAAPSAVTPNTNSSYTTSYSYNGALETTSASGPAGSVSMTYDVVGQPSTATSVYGAVTNYTYNYNSTATTVTATLMATGRAVRGMGLAVR